MSETTEEDHVSDNPILAPSYRSFSHTVVAHRLRSAHVTGKLGSGPAEISDLDYSAFLSIIRTVPYGILIFQIVWSSVVTLIGFGLADKNMTAFSTAYWTSRLSVSSSISYGVGWALFVLLGFFIREASNRYWDAQVNWSIIGAILRQIARHIRQTYPQGTWHEGDIDRIIAHLVAYPIALKMMLRGEREAMQFDGILHKEDIDDVLNSDSFHTHCMRVVRTYISAAEEDCKAFEIIAADATPAGWGARYLVIDQMDAADFHSNNVMKISRSSPAKGYVTHLHVFLYLWMFFLPLALIKSSGWFTILWAVLTSYGVGMLFTIGQALSDPFGYDMQDIKLNHLAAEAALITLNAYSKDNVDLVSLVKKVEGSPKWLETPTEGKNEGTFTERKHHFTNFISNRLGSISKGVLVYLVVAILWCAFVLFLSYSVRQDNDDLSCRWWCIYIPVDSSITSYVSLGIFLTLGFWLNVAYSRYWRALQLWQSKIRTSIEKVAFNFALTVEHGVWHEGDRERLFSHITALAFTAKQKLRNSRNTEEMSKFLSPEDVSAFDSADDLFAHATDVVYGYLNSLDMAHETASNATASPWRAAVYSIEYTLWNLEYAIQECVAIKKFPISQSYTTHLKIFTFFWLSLLPLSLIQFAGFFSFLYIIPISYSIINLIRIGENLADPFGKDEEDIPVDLLCAEIKDSIHNIYNETYDGAKNFVRKSKYSRDDFGLISERKFTLRNNSKGNNESNTNINIWKQIVDAVFTQKSENPDGQMNQTKIGKFIRSFPMMSLRGMLIVYAWTVSAVLLSYWSSFWWADEKRSACIAWCSPIDVNGAVLGNIGFALFMILSFRASDAIGRYEEGAAMLFDVEMNLRNLAMEFVQSFKDNFYHENDKERIVAHIMQIPLSFRDQILNIERNPEDEQGLLSEEDKLVMQASSDPIAHLLHTIESYILLQDHVERPGFKHVQGNSAAVSISMLMLGRISSVRETISRAFGVKRYPVISSYKKHQHLFTALWLLLLPLAMAPTSGFYTILWAPIISFAVLALEEIAAKLVDPYGNDKLDIPVNEMCISAASSIAKSVESIEWRATYHLREMDPKVRGEDNLDKLHTSLSVGNDCSPIWRTSGEEKRQNKLSVHLIRSVPWGLLLFVVLWTTVAMLISYFSRDREATARWWSSRFVVSTTVATYLSFAAFMLLGFFVSSAFTRYMAAGSVWGARLRAACHTLAIFCQTLTPDGAIHQGDHHRMLRHIAVIPLVLKQELRDSRNLDELNSLLPEKEILTIQSADSMVVHCVDVIRSYFITAINHPDLLKKPAVRGSREAFVKYEINELESMIRQSKFLRSFEIAPGFLVLLNFFLALWFFALPFALAKYSGWFTILWVSIIAYGVLGMYQIAKELQFPFGTDMNDFDLDSMAEVIVSDILYVEKHCKPKPENFSYQTKIAPFWQAESYIMSESSPNSAQRTNSREFMKLALHTISPIYLGGVLLWSTLLIVIAWVISRAFPFEESIEESCSLWFCSRIAMSGTVKEYIGFALFLLLGFRLYESHGRYVSAIGIWSKVLATTRMIANRWFESYPGGEWHKEDRERISGHLAAFSVALMSKLRDEDCVEEFQRVLGDEDVEKLLRSNDKADYCLDVLNHYIIQSDEWRLDDSKMDPASFDEQWCIMYLLKMLKDMVVDCEELVKVPMPFGYVQHLRIFLVIWLLLLPLGLVETSGWLTILWIGFIAHGVIGIEKWSEELCNPFGRDLSDVPMDQYVLEAAEIVKRNMQYYSEGMHKIIRDDRPSLCIEKDS